MTETHETRGRQRRRDLVTVAFVGSAFVGGLYTAASCIVGEDPVFMCGRAWSAVALGARAVEDGTPIEVLEGTEWITVDDACVPNDLHGILEGGWQADCQFENNQTDCENVSGCSWEAFEHGGRSTEICIYDSDAFRDGFRIIVERLEGECESFATSQGWDPYPCEGEASGPCTSLSYCTWTGTECVFNFDTCTDAAIKSLPTTEGAPCWKSAGQCEIEQIGGTDTEGGLPPPSSVITQLSSTEWEVDEIFFDEILANPILLLEDSARIEPWPWGGYYFTNVASGDIAYELGFRSGDKIIKVNEFYVGSDPNIIASWDTLVNLDAWVIKIQRGTEYYDFYYDLV